MRKMFFIVLAAATLSLLTPAQNANAQSETPKIELGAHYTVLRLRDFDTTDSGVGGRITYNITNSIGIEGEYNFFPEKRVLFTNPFYLNSRRTQGLFGVKAGMRSEKAGVFGKLRPGFVHFGEGTFDPTILTILPVPPAASSTEFALDAGGVLELYPSRAVALRFDVGDTMIRFGGLGYTSHNLQFTAGVGFRF